VAIASQKPKQNPYPKCIAHKESVPSISSRLTPEQVAKQGLREKAELVARVKYLQTELGQLVEEKRSGMRNARSPTEQRYPEEPAGEERNPYIFYSQDGEARRPFQPRERSHLDFKVDIPEFEG